MLELDVSAIRIFDQGRRRRLARRFRWGASLAYLGVVGAPGLLPAVPWLVLGVLALAVVAWIVELSSAAPLMTEGVGAPGRVAVDEAGLLRITDGTSEEAIAVSEIDAGWTEEPNLVVLSLARGRLLSLTLPDAEARSALLSKLGVSAAERVLRIPIYSAAGGVPFGELSLATAGVLLLPLTLGMWTTLSITAWGLLAVSRVPGLFPLLVVALITAGTTLASWLLLHALRRRQVVVGTDGIVIEGTVRKPIPFSEIESVSEAPNGVALRTKSGKNILLPTGRRDPAFPTPQTDEQAARAQRLLERVKEALAHFGTSRLLQHKASWLECPDEDLEAWRARLKNLRENSGDYRRPGIGNHELIEIARDAGRSVDQRAGAVFVLGERKAELDAAHQVIESCAEPELGKILKEALDGILTKHTVKRALRHRIVDADLAPPELDEASAEPDSVRRRTER